MNESQRQSLESLAQKAGPLQLQGSPLLSKLAVLADITLFQVNEKSLVNKSLKTSYIQYISPH